MDDSLFTIDTSPTVRNDIDVPKYEVERKSIELQELEEKSSQKPRAYSTTCWNCGRPHSIRECDMQSNPYTLEWNREIQMLGKNYQMKKFQKNAGRYHDVDKISGKYARTVPGPISHRLRKLIGLAESDLPSYIYRLRTHGYPAAWLKYATVKPSGINLYDKDGKEVADPNAEEGEILEEEDKLRYDLAKLIKFPGFNASLPTDCVDNFEKYDVPPYNPDQNLEHMIKDLKEKAVTEYVLHKNLSITSSGSAKETETEMEIDAGEKSIPEEEESTSSLLSGKLTSSLTTDVDTSSNDASQDSVSESHTESRDSSVVASERSSLGRILSSAEGTPLLRSKSGHSRLPPRENFSKDICDVINFENLPESTGTFERMRGLFKKVKSVLGLQQKSS